MNSDTKLFKLHEFYNLSRYLFLNIEWDYNSRALKNGITLPQLRVLWIVAIFQSISNSEISKFGHWSPPTVTKILVQLMEKNYIFKAPTKNKKVFEFVITNEGREVIKVNTLTKSDAHLLVQLLEIWNKLNLDMFIDTFRSMAKKLGNDFIFEYVEKINSTELKIKFSNFTEGEAEKLKEIVLFYNLLRTFVLSIENNHRNMLSAFNISYPQLRALWILEAFPGITSKQLSQIAFWAQSTANIIVTKLYEKKLIVKEKSQLKNSLFLYVSDIGQELLFKEFKANQKNFLIYEKLMFLSVDELSEITELLLKMNIHLKNDIIKGYLETTISEIKKRLQT